MASKTEHVPKPTKRRLELERSSAHEAIAGAVFGLFLSFRLGGHRQQRARGDRSLESVAFAFRCDSFIHGAQGNGREACRSFFRKGNVDRIVVEVLDYDEFLAVKVQSDPGGRGEVNAERGQEDFPNGVELFPRRGTRARDPGRDGPSGSRFRLARGLPAIRVPSEPQLR
jgi:hypothetical protein